MAPCLGYRDTQQLRIRIESQSVARKASKRVPHLEPRSVELSLDSQARDLFFVYYVTSKCWDFLRPYHHPTDTPEHLTLAIEAVSLAYLWHQVHSNAALVTAREKYISALRMINQTLSSSGGATKNTTLMASLLLDLFEKITNRESRNKAWTSHMDGAIALVKLRGLDNFQDYYAFAVLERLCTHYIVGCIASDSSVPTSLKTMQAYIVRLQTIQDPRVRLPNLLVRYANIRSEITKGVLSNDKYVEMSEQLDEDIQTLDLELPPPWHYSTMLLNHKSDRAFDIFHHYYANPKVCQARNLLRIIRIFVNEFLIESHLASPTDKKCLASIRAAQDHIRILAGEICACVPQYVDCDDAARPRLPLSERQILDGGRMGADRIHTLDHHLDCYALIFPLYIAGRSKAAPHVRPWVIRTLHYIASHFNIPNAEFVGQILEQGTDIGPWSVYAMLGSYAFAS